MLRLLSMFLIVILHVLGQGGAMIRISSHPWTYNACWILETCAFCAVNCYGLISGYVGVGSRNRPGRIVSLWVGVWFYSALIALLYFLFSPGIFAEIGAAKAFSDLMVPDGLYWVLRINFPVCMNNYWYFSSYVGVFFLAPFLNRMLSGLSREEQRRLMRVVFFLFCLGTMVPKVFSSDYLYLRGGYCFAWLLLLYLFGGCMKLTGLPDWGAPRCLLVYVSMVLLSWGWKIGIENVTRKAFGKTMYGRLLMTYTSPTVFLCAVGLVCLFVRLRLRTKTFSRLVRIGAPSAFFVYIIHTHPLIWDGPLHNAFRSYGDMSPLGAVLASAGTAALIFMACLLADFARRILFYWLKRLRRRND